MANYEIWVRDRNLNRVGSVTHFKKFEMVMKFNDVGKWVLEVPIESPEANLLLEVRRQGNGVGGILVTRDGVPIFSGPIRNVELKDDQRDEDGYTFYGIDDNGLLATRLALPPPYHYIAGVGYGYDKFRGRAESAMIHLVRKNIGDQTTSSSRSIRGLKTNQDLRRGEVVAIRSRLHPLITKLQEAATIGGGLGFRMIQTQNGVLDFQVYQPQNKTDIVVFSRDRGNLGAYRYQLEAPTGNLIIIGGGGEDTERTFMYSGGDGVNRSLYGRIEMFVDQRNTSEQEELLQSLYKSLDDNDEKANLEISPLDVSPTRYLIDYDLGDICTVEVRQERIQDVIRSITLKLDKDGEQIVPTVGNSLKGVRLLDQYRNLESRIGNLERR
ncbi:siphovirus ReqiPepy6 Gp37-like family protein [Thermoactinomyces sp. DSM 45892]|uniref:Gp37-like protein n=1 Tax=Thermoactinomyces sp. DSM 45892 TaxID=1882753 RepID=UPI0008962F1A|nr:siphovirus ReqiPepy6 Gp37-like family protein [Thermoactinomyces sp. DSM 45892]SDZ01108.1 virus ReqiPepy6 Gp37-like protein [Thermoactinomyces sp. DSM 45892]